MIRVHEAVRSSFFFSGKKNHASTGYTLPIAIGMCYSSTKPRDPKNLLLDLINNLTFSSAQGLFDFHGPSFSSFGRKKKVAGTLKQFWATGLSSEDDFLTEFNF